VGTIVSFGGSLQFTATARNAAGTAVSAEFTWVSSDPSVAVVNVTGGVSGVSNGVSSVTATAAGVGSNAVTVTVAQALAIVLVTPAAETLIAVGDATVFTATGTDANGSTIMDEFVWEWSSSSEAVAIVDADGNAIAQGPGSTSITATTAGISGSGQLVVDPVPVARLEMPESVGVGDQVSVDVRLLSTGYGSVTGAFAFTLNLDPSVLQYSTGSTDYYVALVVDNTGSTMTMVTSVPTGLPDNTVVVTLVFDVVGGAGGPTDLVVSIDRLIEALTFNDLTGDGVGETRSLLIQ